MHDAYLSHLLLKLPLQVESLTSAGDQVSDQHILADVCSALCLCLLPCSVRVEGSEEGSTLYY